MTPDEHTDLLARVTRAQADLAAVRRILEANPPTPPGGYGDGAYGAAGYPGADPLTEG